MCYGHIKERLSFPFGELLLYRVLHASHGLDVGLAMQVVGDLPY